MSVLVLNLYPIEDLINTIENQTKAVNDIQVHRLALLVPRIIVVINLSEFQYLFVC